LLQNVYFGFFLYFQNQQNDAILQLIYRTTLVYILYIYRGLTVVTLGHFK